MTKHLLKRIAKAYNKEVVDLSIIEINEAFGYILNEITLLYGAECLRMINFKPVPWYKKIEEKHND